MFLRVSIAAAAALVLCGCITAEQQASVAEPPKPITCHAGADCDAKWSRANAWITEHSKYKAETSSESLIRTSSPSTFETDTSPTYKVAKVAALFSVALSGRSEHQEAARKLGIELTSRELAEVNEVQIRRTFAEIGTPAFPPDTPDSAPSRRETVSGTGVAPASAFAALSCALIATVRARARSVAR